MKKSQRGKKQQQDQPSTEPTADRRESVRSNVTSLPIGQLGRSAANEAAGEASHADLLRVREILFGDTSRHLEHQVKETDERAVQAIAQLQQSVSSTEIQLRKESKDSAATQQRALKQAQAALTEQFGQKIAELEKVHEVASLRTATELAALRKDTGNRLSRQAISFHEALAGLRDDTIDRQQMAALLEQMAKQLRGPQPADRSSGGRGE